jgi:phage-related protein
MSFFAPALASAFVLNGIERLIDPPQHRSHVTINNVKVVKSTQGTKIKNVNTAPAKPMITYKRNKHGNMEIHCETHKFPRFIFDLSIKKIIGVQQTDGIYSLTNVQMELCDQWGLPYLDKSEDPPSYEK